MDTNEYIISSLPGPPSLKPRYVPALVHYSIKRRIIRKFDHNFKVYYLKVTQLGYLFELMQENDVLTFL